MCIFNLFYLLKLFVCGEGGCAVMYVWKSEDKFMKLILSIHLYMWFRNKHTLSGLCSKFLHLLSHLLLAQEVSFK